MARARKLTRPKGIASEARGPTRLKRAAHPRPPAGRPVWDSPPGGRRNRVNREDQEDITWDGDDE